MIYEAVTSLMTASRGAKPRKTVNGTVFDAILQVKLVGIACVALFVILAGFFAIPRAEAGASALFGVIALIGVLVFPRLILADDAGLKQRDWRGRMATIRWGEIDAIEYHQGPLTTVVKSRTGTKITHSRFHRATEEFRALCKRHGTCPMTTRRF